MCTGVLASTDLIGDPDGERVAAVEVLAPDVAQEVLAQPRLLAGFVITIIRIIQNIIIDIVVAVVVIIINIIIPIIIINSSSRSSIMSNDSGNDPPSPAPR